MKLVKLLENLDYQCTNGNIDIDILDIEINSSKDCTNKIFIAISGYRQDGHDYIDEAIKNGAKAVAVIKESSCPPFVTQILVKDTKKALALMSRALFDFPDKKLITIAVTGTKGKTTTSYFLKNIMEAHGTKCGLIGTIANYDGKNRIESNSTTPSSYDVYRMMKEMTVNGCKVVVVEVSSQGVMLDRIFGIDFDYGIFTNIYPDHIGPGEHDSFEEYLQWKGKLFRNVEKAIINCDDPYHQDIENYAKGTTIYFGLGRKSWLKVRGYKPIRKKNYLGISFYIGRCKFSVPFPGKHNLYNALGAITLCKAMGLENSAIRDGLESTKVEGRTELIEFCPRVTLMVDYAHNPIALEVLLKELRRYKHSRIVTVFGCGGDRDPSRRWKMGKVSGELSDLTIVTSDNPRREEPGKIMAGIVRGVKMTKGQYIEIPNREEAIYYAMKSARKSDIIVIAGKGHETYQIIGDTRNHFDDREVVKKIAKELIHENI